jgi:nucleotide-binding universal stress UspA family protein
VIVPKAPPQAGAPQQRIVAGIDGSVEAATALRWAAAEALTRGAILEVVLAWSLSTMTAFPSQFPLGGPLEEDLEAGAAQIVERTLGEMDLAGVEVIRTVTPGHPAEVLIERATSAQLLVVGTRGLGRAREALLGSVSHACAHRSPVPIAIVRHSD